MKFFKRKEEQPQMIKPEIAAIKNYTPAYLTKLAETKLNEKLNNLAEFIEKQNWSIHDTYVIFNIIIENNIKPKLNEKDKQLLKETLDIVVVKKEA